VSRVIALCVAIAACERPTLSAETVDGPTVFAATCAVCHGPKGQPAASMVARIGVRDLTAPDVRARLTPEHVENQVRFGSSNKLMPALEGAITDAQIKAVAAWVASPQFLAQP
jgi:mono/diheme cytochrome c family protein